MMAAVQPALSGAISKTVNLPESATVEDIESIYTEGWKLGLKALAVYRDNCKVGQPLSDARKKPAAAAAEPAATPHEVRPVRRRLPKNRTASVTSFSVAGAEGYMTASTYPDDGVGELFLKLGKQGSTLAGVMDAFSMAISISLQYGVPLEKWVEKFTNMRFEPAGITDDPDIRIASSVLDYVFRRLALDHLPYETRAEMGILSASERTAQLAGEDPTALAEEQDPGEMAQSAPVERPQAAPRSRRPAGPAASYQPHSSTELIEAQQGRTADAPLCLTCGTRRHAAARGGAAATCAWRRPGQDSTALADEQDPGEMAQSAPVERPHGHAGGVTGTSRARRVVPAAQLHRADRGPAGPHRGCAAVPDLRHQDAPGAAAATSAKAAAPPAAAVEVRTQSLAVDANAQTAT